METVMDKFIENSKRSLIARGYDVKEIIINGDDVTFVVSNGLFTIKMKMNPNKLGLI